MIDSPAVAPANCAVTSIAQAVVKSNGTFVVFRTLAFCELDGFATPVSSNRPLVMKAPDAPVPIPVMPRFRRKVPFVVLIVGVSVAEPNTVLPHLRRMVSASDVTGVVKYPSAETCKNVPLANVFAGIVVEPVTVPITLVSAAVLLGPACVVEEKNVVPAPPPPPRAQSAPP